MSTVLYWTTAAGAPMVVKFDVVMSETHEATSSITDHPVELGANVTDHSRAEPETLSLEGFVSNTPLPVNVGQTSDSDAIASFMSYSQMPLTLPQARTLVAGAKKLSLSLPQPPVQPNVVGVLGAAKTGLLGPPQVFANVADYTNIAQTALAANTFQSTGDFFDRVWRMYETLLQARKEASLITAQTAVEFIDSLLISKIGVPRTVADGTGATFQLDMKRVRIVRSATTTAPVPAEARGQPAMNKGSQATSDASSDDDANSQSILDSIVSKVAD